MFETLRRWFSKENNLYHRVTNMGQGSPKERLARIREVSSSSEANKIEMLVSCLGDREVSIRLAAVDALELLGQTQWKEVRYAYNEVDVPDCLVRIGNPLCLWGLIRILETGEGNALVSATIALGKLGDRRATLALIPQLKNEARNIRSVTVKALGKIGDPTALSALKASRGRDSGDADMIQEIDASIAEIKRRAKGGVVLNENTDTRVLLNVLRHGQVGERVQAAKLLGHNPDRPMIEALTEALGDRDEAVRYEAAEALASYKVQTQDLQEANAVPALIGCLKATNARLRKQAAICLGRIGDSTAVIPLTQLLDDSIATVRLAGVAALAELLDPGSVPALGAALRDTDFQVRKAAIRALGRFNSPAAVALLCEALQFKDIDERLKAMDALRACPKLVAAGTSAIPTLVRLIGQGHDIERGPALDTLCKFGPKFAISPLLQCLAGSDPRQRLAVARALRDLGEPQWEDLIRGDSGDLGRLAESGDPRLSKDLASVESVSKPSHPAARNLIACVDEIRGVLLPVMRDTPEAAADQARQALFEKWLGNFAQNLEWAGTALDKGHDIHGNPTSPAQVKAGLSRMCSHPSYASEEVLVRLSAACGVVVRSRYEAVLGEVRQIIAGL